MRLRKIQRHLRQVVEDDTLLLKEDMGRGLTEAEVREALEERGMCVKDLVLKKYCVTDYFTQTHQ